MDNPIIIVAMDCKRKDIWRNSLFEKYKEGRACDPYIGEIFNIVATDELFKKANVKMLLQHPTLEADDCLALTVKNIKGVVVDYKIHIITSDMDYLQLAEENVKPINLKYKYLQDSKQSFKDCKKDLFCKIVMGDKSDAIPSVFPKCGIKTAEKYYNDPVLFEQKLKIDVRAQEQFTLNTTLIDFKKIPTNLILEFNSGNYTTKY
jgi:5'-3' exonuclease